MSTTSTTDEPTVEPEMAPREARLTKTELLRARAESTAVSEVMSRSVVCLAPEAQIDAVTEMFLDRGLSSAPVVDEDWLPLGMVSKTDLLRVYAEQSGVGESLRERAAGSGGGHDVQAAPSSRVGDITMPYVLSLHEEAPVSVAAALMAYEGVHRIPIVASSGEVVGVISTLDIVRWVARCTDLEVAADPA